LITHSDRFLFRPASAISDADQAEKNAMKPASLPAVWCLTGYKHEENLEYSTDKQNKAVPGQPGNGEVKKTAAV